MHSDCITRFNLHSQRRAKKKAAGLACHQRACAMYGNTTQSRMVSRASVHYFDNLRFQIVFDMERDGDDRRIRYIKNTLIDPEQLIWRKWKPLAEGGDLHLRQRGGWRDRFKSPDQVWAETIDLAISQQIGIQEFVDLNYRKTLYYFVPFTQRENGKWYSRREPNSHGFARQISAPAAEKILAISYIASHFLFASAKYLLAQNCTAPSGVAIFDRFWWDFAKQDTNLAS